MEILVSLKHVLDPDVLARDCSLDPVTGDVSTSFPRYDIDQYDANALEIALQMKGKYGARVIAVCVGPESAEDTLRKAAALQVDEVVRIDATRATDAERAQFVASFTRERPDIAMVLCGRVASDTDSVDFGPALAAQLDWPMLPNVISAEVSSDGSRVTRECRMGREIIEAREPLVLLATSAVTNKLRTARLPDVMRAHKQKVSVISPANMVLGEAGMRSSEVVRRFIPKGSHRCRIIEEDTPEEVAMILTDIINASVKSSRVSN